jgi:ABC-type transport system involved in multi-copper enzyme maturation permease subunit
MNAFPIVERELRISARRSATYYTRCVTATLAAVTAISLLYAGFVGALTPGSAGQGLFQALAVIAYLYAILEGAILTADSLSRERREDTLGLLFLTHLKARDIIAGKLASSVGRTMYSLLAALPIPGITIFFGGVTLADLLMMMAAVLNALLFSTAIGLCVSAYVKSELRALSWTLALTFLAGALWPIVGLALHAATVTNAGELFLLVSPAGPLAAAINFGGARLPAPDFWASLALTQAIAWGLLIMAGKVLQRSWRDTSDQASKAGLFRRIFRRNKEAKPTPKPRRLGDSWSKHWRDRNPIVWLGERAGNPRRLVVSMLIVSVAVNFPFLVIDFESWFGVSLLACNTFLFHVMCASSAFDQICRSVIEDRKSGALELLLTTRLDQDDFINGRLLAQMRLMTPPLCLMLLNDTLLLAALWIQCPPDEAAIGTLFVLGWMALQYPGHIATCWVALWHGFKATTSAAATRQAGLIILGVPSAIFAGSIALWGAVTGGRGLHSDYLVIGGLWAMTLMFLTASYYLGIVISDLRDNFRELALSNRIPVKSPTSWWKFWRRKPKPPSKHRRDETIDALSNSQP